jgi:enoyl-[acyl-carrier-protein] reductase (NADH)
MKIIIRHFSALSKQSAELHARHSGSSGSLSLPTPLAAGHCWTEPVFAQIKRKKGKLDIVFANAGITPMTPLSNITEEDYDSLFDAKVKVLLFTVQKALPLMPDGGSIILNASITEESLAACRH